MTAVPPNPLRAMREPARLGRARDSTVARQFPLSAALLAVILTASMVRPLTAAQAPQTIAQAPPPYANAASFTEQDVRFGADPWILPGTLTIPRAAGPHPAVVLVHGSGPADRDETVGVLKPFRDLAWGLASMGTAVLRYEKRTRVHGARMLQDIPRLTVKEEVIDDAIAAVAFLRGVQGLDPERLFVIGDVETLPATEPPLRRRRRPR